MNILVTGATGFLGRTLCPRLERDGHRLTRLGSKDADLTNPRALDAFAAERFDHIYHLAAWTQAGDFCLHHAGEQWVINQQINTHVLAWWRQRQPQAKLICLGSSCGYAPDSDLQENQYLVGEPIDSLFVYAMTKRMLLVGCRALQQQFGLKHLCVVPSTLYGPGYHEDGRQMHFIFDLIRKILRGKELGEPVTLWGDGHQRRELVFTADFAEALVQLAGRVNNDLVNIGAGEDHSIRDFARMICEQVGYPSEHIRYDATRYVGAAAKKLNIEKMRGLLPPFKTTPLAEGLAQTIRWFQDSRAYLNPAEKNIP